MRDAGASLFRAVSFDGDGTLWDFETAMRRAMHIAARRFEAAGLRPANGAATVEWLIDVRDEVARRPDLEKATMEAIRLEAFRESIRRCDPAKIDLASEIYDEYMANRFAQLALFPDARAAMDAVRADYRVALVTNGNTHPGRVGLDTVLNAVVVAAQVGVRKPDPRIYRAAAERLEANPAECVHVGNDPVEDVAGARAAGMVTIWLNRTQASWPNDLEPAVAELADLHKLSETLIELEARARTETR